MDVRNAWPTLAKGCIVLSVVGVSDASGWDGDTYVLSVRNMEITHDVNTDDKWSPAPDLVVRIEREDRDVSSEIERLEKENSHRTARRKYVAQERGKLLEQRAKNQEKPAEPLTETQMERLTALREAVGYLCANSSRVCRSCPEGADFDTCYACAKCPELELLQWRKKESERVPVPPLTEAQLRRLNDYEHELATLDQGIAGTRKAVAELVNLIFGTSRKIETSSRQVDFGDRDVIRVHPDDRITVSVWDDDVFNDDLYGRATVILDRATLEHGTLDVTNVPNIKFVRLKFRRDERMPVRE